MLQHDDFPEPLPSDQLNRGRRLPKGHAVQVRVNGSTNVNSASACQASIPTKAVSKSRTRADLDRVAASDILPQRTILNKRCQRTDHGQRHTCQACAPSPIEKKMISARPMMFSNGT